MWASFKYSLLQLVRVPGVLIWTLAFPIVLGSLFVMMFGALDERAEAVSVNVIVIDEEQAKGEERSALSFENIAQAAQAGAQVGSVFDEETFGEQAFATFMEALGEGDDALFNITYVSSPEEAAALVRESLGTDDEYAGYVQYADGEVRTVLAKATSAAETYEVEPSILMMIMDRYVAEEALIKETLQKNPAALADPGFIETLMAPVEATVRASVTITPRVNRCATTSLSSAWRRSSVPASGSSGSNRSARMRLLLQRVVRSVRFRMVRPLSLRCLRAVCSRLRACSCSSRSSW